MKTNNELQNSYLTESKHDRARSLATDKFKSEQMLLFEQYHRAQLAQEQMYVIDKIVRMRGLQGRFGADHSEILNIEVELANKSKDDHLHKLVYSSDPYDEKENMQLSKILFKRLDYQNKEEIPFYQETNGTADNSSKVSDIDSQKKDGLAFNEWLRRKKGDERLKQKLVKEAKLELRTQIIENLKIEQALKEAKVKAMEEWLVNKKMSEAQKIAHLRDLEEKEAIKEELKKEKHFRTFKQWHRHKQLEEKHDRYMQMAAKLDQRQR